MTRIACLHTAGSNIAVFEMALAASGLSHVTLEHVVRADLLAAAERAGALSPQIVAQTVTALRELCDTSEAVLLTCSTLGPCADAAAEGIPIPIMRADAALAAEAVKNGGRIVVLCATETTVEPTRELFERAARPSGAEIVVQLVPRAWDAFKAGDTDRYLRLVAHAATEARKAGATQVALAQASMAAASDLLPDGPRPLSSPLTSLLALASLGSETLRHPRSG